MAELIDIPSPGWPLTFGEPGNPSVVLVHDSFGRLPYLESYATALASRDLFVVVPDLFNGVATIDEASADELRDGIDLGFALATLDDAIELGRGHGFDAAPSGGVLQPSTKVALLGFELGGWLALRAAQAGSVDAVVAYAAGLGESEAGVIPCPVLLNYSDLGDWGTTFESDLFVSRLKEMGTPVARHTYSGTHDIFANATLVERLDKNAAALAFARSTYFLQEQLAT
ncbi:MULTISPECIES: dienelactone hydrolase family protein [Subtercola]|uniref:Dienelactone hydrolase n=1 Tax=Subtercola vilae TaxID=2056433 RepID=A0A4T2C8Y3_9MICO|nr:MULTISPECIES: dienelactone hydrolase family protein [Subtercola]MEA9984012.1 dienelactone hydrolase family protein [Subtercola sp. RTI3]TIH40923.1 dienelactone hydrolase [Subtercola vilae]